MKKNIKGFIDPISLIGLGFLIVTLTVGVSVTNNPIKKFLIDSLAGGRVKNCADYGSAAKRNACEEGENAQDPTSQTYADQQAYRDAHPDIYKKTTIIENGKTYEVTTKNGALNNKIEIKTTTTTTTSDDDELRNKSVCLQDGGAWSGGGCSYQQQKEAIAKTQELIRLKAEKIAQEQALAEKQRLEEIKLRDEKITADELASKARIAEEQRLAEVARQAEIRRQQQLAADAAAAIQHAQTEDAKKYLQAQEAARLAEVARQAEQKRLADAAAAAAEQRARFGNAGSGSTKTEPYNLEGLGTTGLGGGNAPVVTPPLNVITSQNSNDLANFYRGAAYSAGAGAVASGAILTGAGGTPLLTQVLTPTVLKTLTVANLISDTVPIVNCAATQNPEACQEAAFSISNPIPGGQYADDITDAMNVFGSSKIPKLSVDEYASIRGLEIRNNMIDFVKNNPDITTYAGSREAALNLDYDSPASNQTSELAQELMDIYGYDTGKAITKASNSVLPPYDHAGQYIEQADKAFTIEELLACPGGRCRHFEPISSKVANDMGFETTRYNSVISGGGSTSGHRFSVMTLSPTEKILLDSTNNLSGQFNVFEDLANIFPSQWKVEVIAPFQILDP